MAMIDRNISSIEWTCGAIPFARSETHDKVIEMLGKESIGKVLGVPAGTGILAGRFIPPSSWEKMRLRRRVAVKLRFEVSGDR